MIVQCFRATNTSPSRTALLPHRFLMVSATRTAQIPAELSRTRHHRRHEPRHVRAGVGLWLWAVWLHALRYSCWQTEASPIACVRTNLLLFVVAESCPASMALCPALLFTDLVSLYPRCTPPSAIQYSMPVFEHCEERRLCVVTVRCLPLARHYPRAAAAQSLKLLG